MNIRLGQVVQLLRGGERRDRGQSLRSGRRGLGWRACFQYIGLPIIHDGSLDGQALVGHERVADEHDVVLSPSDCRQKIGEIAIAGDEDDCGWRWVVLDERHDIH